MAKAAKPFSVLLLLLLLLTLFITSLFSTMAVQGSSTRDPLPQLFFSVQATQLPFEGRKERRRNWGRRLMIGSTAPTCTYNECRGCKYKCRAEQVPVEGNDPINSAYHYRCVCHRFPVTSPKI
ncbi:hypothetical protein IC582_002177 [Cucumis melo]|uniref:Uncharacterized protein LOC127148191 n=2 Tax=Cucumis melo TaxID=3656 RepID=A0ABM3KHV6_CUCME|nr:uncharacterized protein LOC127148191 [Cucumis melo]